MILNDRPEGAPGRSEVHGPDINRGRLYPLPPPYSPSTYQELVAVVGIDPPDEWVVIDSMSAIDAQTRLTTLRIVGSGLPDSSKILSEDLKLGDGCMFRLIGRRMPRPPEPGEWPAWTVKLPPSWPYGDALTVQTWLMQAWQPQGVLVAQVVWSPNDTDGDRSIRTLDNSWRDTDLTNAGKALRFLEGLTAPVTVGRTRLEDEHGWPALMRSIDDYLRKPGTSLDSAVRRFDLANLAEFDDEDFDAEIEGEDIYSKRHKAALGKLKRHRSRWKKLPESKKRAEFT